MKKMMILAALGVILGSFSWNSVYAEDTYANYADLAAHEQLGVDYSIRSRTTSSQAAIIAIHGGKIEPGTSQITEKIAGDDHNLYLFEGTKSANNHDLHITSTHFDEPTAVKLVAKAHKVVSVHGADGDQPIVYLGGKNEALKDKISQLLSEKNFVVKPPLDGIAGTEATNICNLNRTQAGVQLELTRALRDELVSSTDRMNDFATAVRNAISAVPANSGRVFDFDADSFTSSTYLNGGKVFYVDSSDYILGIQNPNNTSDTITVRFNIYDQNNKLVLSKTKTSQFREGYFKHVFTGLPTGYYKIEMVNLYKQSAYIHAGLHY
ncbi:poly-gamma-glutamate hydrolase family protein [Laceyella putida]|uniref:Poly-gamma-glutamate hydrolase family protein n=1 Tax=Laceyella putida TaxID=110101 RepID=A0ABW2RGW3_9BACL